MDLVRRTGFSILLMTLCSVGGMAWSPQSTQRMKGLIHTEGSVPQAPTLYACVHALDGKSFSETLVDECKTELAAINFIREVQVSTKEGGEGWVVVEFGLFGESLKLDDVTITTFDEDETKLRKLLSLNASNLHVAGDYSLDAELSSYNGIRQYYRAKGQLVGVVPKVVLDFSRKRASVEMRVVPGPMIPPHPLVPPCGRSCLDRIGLISWWDTGDEVPIELVESGLALRSPFTCYSVELSQRDKQYLANLPFLTSHEVEYSGDVGKRLIKYKLKAKPLRISKVDVEDFGTASPLVESQLATIAGELSLRRGDIFSNADMNRSIGYLKAKFAAAGQFTEVTVRQEIDGPGALFLHFCVFSFPLQSVFVDGHEVK